MSVEKQVSRGFTLVELIIVIVVIAILAAIMGLSLSKYQADARDAQRAADVTVISEHLERYYNENGEYPSCQAMTQPIETISNETLKSIETDSFTAPTAEPSTNSMICTDIAAGSRDDVYPYLGDGSPECLTGSSCLEWKIKYLEESSDSYIVVSSRHSTDINTSGEVAADSEGTDFTAITVDWNVVQNANSYTVQYATDSNFTQNLNTLSATEASVEVTGLTYGTTYYFRVQANAMGSQTGWSNTTSSTTWSLSAPTIALTSTSTTVSASWTTIDHTQIYNLQCSANGTTWTDCATSTDTQHTFTGLEQGSRYYYRVEANSGAYKGGWSAGPSIITKVDAPAAYTISSSTTYQTLTATSNAVCPAGTTRDYAWTANSSNWVSGTQYRSVGYTLGWNESVTLRVSTHCQTSLASSTARLSTNTASMSRPGPWATAGLSAYWTASWNGGCPAGTTSQNFAWNTGGNLKIGGNTPSPGSYYNNSQAWGNGGVTATLSCYGPWGLVQASGWGPYGSGCVPTITTSACYN